MATLYDWDTRADLIKLDVADGSAEGWFLGELRQGGNDGLDAG